MNLERRLDLKVGFACNNRCLFCAQGDKRQVRPAFPVGELVKRLAHGRGSGPQGVVLTGGEPTVHRSLRALVAAARRLGYSPIQIQSNGRMLAYPQAVAALLEAGATEFALSLHGASAEIHDGLTRAAGSFSESLSGIKNVIAAGASVITNTVMTQQNLATVPEIVAMLGALGVRQAQLAFVHPVGTALEQFDQVVPRLPDLAVPLAGARRAAEQAGMRLVTEAVPLCFLRGMPELAVEESIPLTAVIDLEGALGNYSAWRVAEGKAHGPPCERCSVRASCEGPWREYPDRLGWDEFEPL